MRNAAPWRNGLLLLACLFFFCLPDIAYAQTSPECIYHPGPDGWVDPDSGITYNLNDVRPQFFYDGGGLATTDPRKCPVTKDHLLSGVICKAQTVIFRSMFHVYCSIFLNMKDIVGTLAALYIMFWGVAILFGIKNTSPRDAAYRALKLVLVVVFITNADLMYFHMFRFLLEFLSEFSNLVMTTAPLLDAKGNLAMYYEVTNPGVWPPDTVVVVGDNGAACKAGTYVNYNPTYGEFPTAACQCETDIVNPDGKVGQQIVTCRTPAPPTDLYGDAVWQLTADGQLEMLDINGNPCGTDPLIPCRQPYDGGIFSKVDVLFKQLVGEDDEAAGILFLAGAIAFVTNGLGFILTILTVFGLVAMFMSFIRLLISYTTAIMALTFLLMLSPIFFSFAFFSETLPLFRRWLQNLFSYALQPVLLLSFLYVLGEAANVQSFVNEAIERNHVKGREVHSFGWKGFWEFKMPAVPALIPFSCQHPTDGWVTGCVLVDAKEDVSTNLCISNYNAYINDGVPPTVAAGCKIRCTGKDGKPQDNCTTFSCLNTNDDGDPLPGSTRKDCTSADEVEPLARDAIGLILAWLILSALIGGFVNVLPGMAATLTRILGATRSTVLGGKSSTLAEMGGGGAFSVDRSQGSVYGLEGFANPYFSRLGSTVGGMGWVGKNSKAKKYMEDYKKKYGNNGSLMRMLNWANPLTNQGKKEAGKGTDIHKRGGNH